MVTSRPTKAMATALHFDLDAFLPYRLATLADGVSRALAKIYVERFDLAIPEWRILANLNRGVMGASALAHASSLDKPAVSRALLKLEARGLVARSTPDDDRRRSTLGLTPKGKRLFAEIAVLAADWQETLLSNFSAAERREIGKVLDKLHARLAHRPAVLPSG